jgi:hypothetical protein
MKGSTSLSELENMPNKFIHTLWKLYIDTMKDKEKSEAIAAEQTMDEMEEAMA